MNTPIEKPRPVFSTGICKVRPAILQDGIPLDAPRIIARLQALDFLLEVKEHKEKHGADDWYEDANEIAWQQARDAMSL